MNICCVFLLNWGQFVFRLAFGVFVCYFFLGCCQGYGLGLDVSVSRRTDVSSRSRLEKNCQRLGLGHLRLVPKTNFRPNYAGHSMQSERALDVVSLCCSYYCSSY